MAEEGQENDARVCGIEKHDVMCWLVEVMCDDESNLGIARLL